ncbi:carboxymuconolactone decarboxylase family protein [Lentzea albida]|uniref:Carboxymuconolactone decarboxylase family protein n=1 Tax=Lentzea albida TaxID=65499 RepID=A0A1H9GT31_9PSEU|nr:carboxymuconolactone decarboxylase family protein [Lentzea albida]SEQ53230.1 Carboxymuconolactone decarboxylase family protein [Lentzea albida]
MIGERRELDELARHLLGGPAAAQWFAASGGVLTPRVREVAALAIGLRHGAAYELYSHSRVAAAIGLPGHVIAALVAGQRPVDLTPEEEVAHDVAAALHAGTPLPGAPYRAAVGCSGQVATRSAPTDPARLRRGERIIAQNALVVALISP